MGILKVARMGHPVLRQTAEPVGECGVGDPEVHRLVHDMLETMSDEDGAGLAAPQVHVSRRVVVMRQRDWDGSSDDDEEDVEQNVDPLVLIDPEVTPASPDRESGWEGCLSVPGLRGLVPRFTHILVSALGPGGDHIALEARGFAARVVQHEVDHLDGILFLDRMPDMRSLAYLEEFRRYCET